MQIREDIFTWNSTHEQRQKATETRRRKAAETRRLKGAMTSPKRPLKTITPRPLVQTPGAPIRPTMQLLSQSPIVPPIQFPIPLQSILQSPTLANSTIQKRRQSKVRARRRRIEEDIPQEKVTHISRLGRVVYYKI